MASERNKSKDSVNTSEVSKMISQLSDERRLSQWEANFIIDVSDKWELNGHLSETQVDKVKQIYEKYNN